MKYVQIPLRTFVSSLNTFVTSGVELTECYRIETPYIQQVHRVFLYITSVSVCSPPNLDLLVRRVIRTVHDVGEGGRKSLLVGVGGGPIP